MLITWDVPTTREDESSLPLNEIAGYELSIDNTDGAENDHLIFVPDGSATSYSLDLPNGDYVVRMRAQDTSGVYGAYTVSWSGAVNETPNIITLTNLTLTATTDGASYTIESANQTGQTLFVAARTSGPYINREDVWNGVGAFDTSYPAVPSPSGAVTGFSPGDIVYFGAVQYYDSNNSPGTTLETGSIQALVSGSPSISVDSSLDFGSVFSSETSTRTLTIANVGGADLTISAISSDESTITLVTGLPVVIGGGSSSAFTFAFDPDYGGVYAEDLLITSNDAASPTAVAITARAEPVINEPLVDIETTGGIMQASTSTAGGTLYCAVKSTPFILADIPDLVAGTGTYEHREAIANPTVGANTSTVGPISVGAYSCGFYQEVTIVSSQSVFRYLLDETAQPSTTNDDSGYGNTLSLQYGAGGSFATLSNGDGLASTTIGEITGGHMTTPTAIVAALTGVTKFTIAFVAEDIAGSTAVERIIHLGTNSGNGQLGICISPDGLEVRFNGESAIPAEKYRRRYTMTGTGNHVYRIEIDTAQASEPDRCKVFKDNSLLTRDLLNSTSLMIENATLDIDAAVHSFWLFNRGDGSRSPSGKLGYAELLIGSVDGVAQTAALAADCNRNWQAPTDPPLVTSGLVLHLETGVGVTTSGTDVTAWADQSGNGNDLDEANGTPQYVASTPNGGMAIEFSSSSLKRDELSGFTGLPVGAADRTLVVVCSYDSGQWGGTGYGKDNAGEAFQHIITNNGHLALSSWQTDITSTEPGVSVGWLVQTATLNSNTCTLYKDNVQIKDGSLTCNTALGDFITGAQVDGAPFVEMKTAAILLYDRALTTEELAQVQTYLEFKYF